jgi:sugar phosphate isomerase/epimerase
MIKPEIGLSMLHSLKEPFNYVTKRLTNLNVDHIELVDEGLHILNKRRIKKLKEIAKDFNLDYVVHAPWVGMNIASPNSILRRTILKRLEKSLINSKKLDCRLWVFHPGSQTALSEIYPEKDWLYNLNSVNLLMKSAKRENVNIAIENVPEPFPFLIKSVNDFKRFFECLNYDLGMVFDVGHANLNNSIKDFIKNFSEKIVHIHISDNDGIQDQHQGIGFGNIEWKNFSTMIKNSGYKNLVMLESTQHIKESLNFLHKLFD